MRKYELVQRIISNIFMQGNLTTICMYKNKAVPALTKIFPIPIDPSLPKVKV